LKDDFIGIQDRVIIVFFGVVISSSQHFFEMLLLAFVGDLQPGNGKVTSLVIKSMPKMTRVQKNSI
jgi:hypothetical protein